MSTPREQRLREKLTGEIGVSSWKGLIPETLTKSLFLVSQGLDLVEVGVQVALDNTGEVKKWIEGGLLARPTREQIADWESYGSLFRFIIVAPFVFFQEYAVSES
ncbi:MAG TPA: DUF2288 family protein [Desulfomonilia bacterium]|nr:DUF2288 family protein [Desulfomonilia bacterium]